MNDEDFIRLCNLAEGALEIQLQTMQLSYESLQAINVFYSVVIILQKSRQ